MYSQGSGPRSGYRHERCIKTQTYSTISRSCDHSIYFLDENLHIVICGCVLSTYKKNRFSWYMNSSSQTIRTRDLIGRTQNLDTITQRLSTRLRTSVPELEISTPERNYHSSSLIVPDLKAPQQNARYQH